MARPYFKKRRVAGPSKNELKVERSRDAAARERGAGRLRERFPGVDRITIELQFFSPQNAPLSDKEKRVFGPNDSPDFAASCPGRCGQGSFDLDAKVQSVIEARQASTESSGVCQEPLFAGAGTNDVCGSRLQCRIDVQYAPDAA